MSKIYNKTLNSELEKEKSEKTRLLSGYQILKIPLLSDSGRSAWPKRFSKSRIKELRERVGEKKFQAQMQLQPIDLTEPYFNIEEFKTYKDGFSITDQNFTSIYKVNRERVHKVSAYWDPSSGGKKRDGSVLTIAFKDFQDKIYIEDVIYLNNHIKITSKNPTENNSITQQIETVLSFLRDYNVSLLHIETNGIGKFIPELIIKQVREKRLKIEISEIYNNSPKAIRIIEGIEPLISAGIIFFNEKIFRKDSQLKSEIKNWRPKVEGKDDGLDSLSGITLNRFKNIYPIQGRIY